MLQAVLRVADTRERLWVWLAIGLGFGNQDIARAKPRHFDQESYDMRRGKTGFERYGQMRLQVWAHLEDYLAKVPREPDELLFVTRNGLPLSYARTKTPQELAEGTRTHGPKAARAIYVNSLGQTWSKLLLKAGVKKEWKGGFYRLRSLGATVFGQRPGVSLLDVRTFLGHGDSRVAEIYMRPLRPEIKDVVRWCQKCLDSSDLKIALKTERKKAK